MLGGSLSVPGRPWASPGGPRAICRCPWASLERSLGDPGGLTVLSGEPWEVLWVSLGPCLRASGSFCNHSKTIGFYCIFSTWDDQRATGGGARTFLEGTWELRKASGGPGASPGSPSGIPGRPGRSPGVPGESPGGSRQGPLALELCQSSRPPMHSDPEVSAPGPARQLGPRCTPIQTRKSGV